MIARTTTARRSRAAAPGRSPLAAPAIPRRVSGPLRGSTAAGAATLPSRRPGQARRLGAAVRGLGALPDHPVIDRLLRGRLWIWAIGLLLGGIVAMQVSLLKLNTGISRAVAASATLEQQNTALEAEIARLSSGERLHHAAAALGMVSPQAGDVLHLTVRPSVDGDRAAARMTEPSEQARLVASGSAAAPGSSAAPAPAPGEAPDAAAPGAAQLSEGTEAPVPPAPAAAPAPAPATAEVPAPSAPAPQG